MFGVLRTTDLLSVSEFTHDRGSSTVVKYSYIGQRGRRSLNVKVGNNFGL